MKKIKFKAFSLLEISIVLIIMSLTSYGLLKSTTVILARYRNNITAQKVEKIYKTLGLFVARNGYLPYPYIPSNNIKEEKGISVSAINNADIVEHCKRYDFVQHDVRSKTNLDKKSIGIVPYTTLGLDEKDVKDGNGNYFTYAINPILGERSDYIQLPHSDPRIRYDFDFDLKVDSTKENSKKSGKSPYFTKADNPRLKHICNFCSVRMYADYQTGREILPPNIMTQKIEYRRSPNPKIQYYAAISDLTCWVSSHLTLYNKDGYNVSYNIIQNFYTVGMSKEEEDNGYYSTYDNKYDLDNLRQFKVSDTIAVILVSHGKSGGYFIKSGKRHPIHFENGVESKAKLANANDIRKFYMAENSNDFDAQNSFDDEVFYISKFHLASMYAGFVCQSHSLWDLEYLAPPIEYPPGKVLSSYDDTINTY